MPSTVNHIHVTVKHDENEPLWTPVAERAPLPMARKSGNRGKLGRHYLKEWREFRKLTQEQAAGRLEVDRTLLSKLENYKAQYTQVVLENCAVAYDCTVEQLLFVNPNFQDAPRLVYDRLKNATAEQQRRATAIIDALLKTG